MMTIVGDAYARPMIEELRRTDYDLSHLAVIGTGGTPTSFEAKRGAGRAAPQRHDPRRLRRVRDRGDGVGRDGGRARPRRNASRSSPAFGSSPATAAASSTPARTRSGWIARVGHVPLGYLDDEDATTATFPVVDGVRVAIPGDRAQLRGRRAGRAARPRLARREHRRREGVRRRGRGRAQAPRRRRRRARDRPPERAVRPGGHRHRAARARRRLHDRASCASGAAARLARYKAPRAFVFVERVERHPSGKANYRWARDTSEQAFEVS